MSSQIEVSFLKIVNRKAEKMKEELETDGKFRSHCHTLLNNKDLLNKTKLDQQERAFLIGAIDAMIFDVAFALAFKAYAAKKFRMELIKNIDF